jgi:hypothetical protein
MPPLHGSLPSPLWSIALRREMLAGLILAGLATIETGTMKAGAATVKVERDRITDDGHTTRG